MENSIKGKIKITNSPRKRSKKSEMKNKRVKKGKKLRSTKFQIIKFQKEEMETHLQNNTKIFPRTKKHGFLKETTKSPIQLMLTEPHTKKHNY